MSQVSAHSAAALGAWLRGYSGCGKEKLLDAVREQGRGTYGTTSGEKKKTPSPARGWAFAGVSEGF